MNNNGLTFIDYNFKLYPDRIEFDHELSLGKLNLKEGQMLQVCAGPQGTVILCKVDPVVAFAQGYAINTPCE